MLSQRQEQILKIMVGEYVATARPVGSALIGRKHGLGISSATIRNEMARLEEEGYITRLHISGGGVPSDQGYRFYVKSLTQESEGVSLEERRMLSHLFHQIELELEEWTRLAAALLARMVHNVAGVTSPKAEKSRIKHLELVALQESLALLILLLQEAKLRQHLIAFDSVVSQDELSMVSNEFNELFNGLTWPQVMSKQTKLTSCSSTASTTPLHRVAW